MRFNMVLSMIVGILLVAGCVQSTTSSTGIAQKTPTALSGSVEQDNLNNRLQIVNNPSTTMWFYGLSQNGTIVFRSTVKGKVTSSTKRLEPKTADDSECSSRTSSGNCSNEAIQADGTFGDSDPYVFWFDNEGQYYQWNGLYILSSKPLLIPSPLIEFQTITEAS